MVPATRTRENLGPSGEAGAPIDVRGIPTPRASRRRRFRARENMKFPRVNYCFLSKTPRAGFRLNALCK